MKIISSFMENLSLKDNNIHTLTFQSSNKLHKFQQMMESFINNKSQSEHEFIKIIDNSGREFNRNEIYIVQIEGNALDLTNEKYYNQIIRQFILQHLYNHSHGISNYMQFHQAIDSFIADIDLDDSKINVDISTSAKLMENIVKSFSFNIFKENYEDIEVYEFRNFIIRKLLELNLKDLPILLYYTFPEMELGFQDYSKLINILKELKLTTLILSTQEEFLTSANLGGMFLINKDGKQYNTTQLKKELIAFKLIEEENSDLIVNQLSYIDYQNKYHYLDDEFKSFFIK